ncbi:hypothetical protein ACILG0_16790 [Pseudomonadota bacterium AL_CKDN230030165-1A_HGKHYDSX7]
MKSRAYVRARAIKIPEGLALALGAALLALVALPDAHADEPVAATPLKADVCEQAAKPYYGLRDTLLMAQGVLVAAGE